MKYLWLKSDGTWRMTVDYRALNKVTLPMYVFVSNIASLMDTLSREIETYHCILDLANVFFSIPIHEELQDQFAFTWGGRQWTFQVLPYGYVHSPTYCLNLVVRDLADQDNLNNIKLYHYIDDLMLTSDSRGALGKAVDSLTTHLQEKGWAINPKKVQGPGFSVKFLGSLVGKDQSTTQCNNRQGSGIPSPYCASQGSCKNFGVYWDTDVPLYLT